MATFVNSSAKQQGEPKTPTPPDYPKTAPPPVPLRSPAHAQPTPTPSALQRPALGQLVTESYVTVMPTHVAEASQAAVHCAYVKLPDCNTLPVQKAFLMGGTLCAGQLCADTPHGRASSATASAAKTCFAAAPSPARPRARIPVRATQHSAAPWGASKAPRAAALADGVLQAAAASRSGAGNGAVSTAGAA